ncbi:hypothetical protein ACIOGZ_41190 [Kitasatospora sp. NPDC088160]|uniref:hypothetical protein n=1 Tax=Kitasatospora sp. NPDC088160 TaxID=3364072 RepID=UPI00381622FF
MEILEEVAPLLSSLATPSHVYAKWGAISEATIAEQVLGLAVVAQADWAHQAVAGAAGPTSALEVESALEPVDEAGAIELMTNLSAFDLVYSRHPLRDRDHAKRAATRVAKLLGRDTIWVTNMEATGDGRAWTPVTRHGIDVVVAGVTAEFFVILLGLGDD